VAYWLQVQSMTEREKRRFDESLVREADAGPARAMTPGQEILAGMMMRGGA
jgi:hypothetical protein